MKKITAISGIIGFVLFGAFAIKQQSAKELADIIRQYFYKRPMERVFMHLDKPYYAAGDELWYAAYVGDYRSGKPSSISEILHVELFDHVGKSILRQKIRIENGLGNGFMELPDTLAANYYSIKAYTNWSRNFEEGLLFNHAFKIVSPNFEAAEALADDDVQFYPEGGSILQEKLNQVAFKSSKPAKTRAYLLDNHGDTLDDFTYDGEGFGLLRLVPKSDTEYYLKFENEANRYQLPPSTSTGTTLRLQERDDVLNLFVEGSDAYAGQDVSILLLHNGNVVSAFDRKLDLRGLFLVFRKNDLPHGLSHLMVFGNQNTLLNQRIFFNSAPNADAVVQVEMKKTFEQREQIAIDLISNHPATSNVSISVTPTKYFSDLEAPRITDASSVTVSTKEKYSLNEQLIAERIGTYNPNVILDKKEPRFDFAFQKKGFFQVEIDLESRDQMQSRDGYLSFSLKRGETVDLYVAEVKETDRLSVIVPSFTGVKDIILRPYLFENESDLVYTFKKSIGNRPLKKPFAQSKIETAYARETRENKATRRLYKIDYSVKKDPKFVSDFSILEPYDERILLRDYIRLTDMKEVFKELLPCARIKENRNGEVEIHLCDNSESVEFQVFMKKEPFRMIDGVPIYDSKIIADLKPTEIESLNMISRKFVMDSVELDGVLHIVTLEGNYGKVNSVGQRMHQYQGYSDEYTFGFPEMDATTPDFRSTLYWNPQLAIGGNESARISFPASDEAGEYQIDIQGVTAGGIPIYYKTYFTVLGAQ